MKDVWAEKFRLAREQGVDPKDISLVSGHLCSLYEVI